jgi:hypothetical protein
MSKQADKVCVRCGRTMQWRAKWAKNWEQVKYCSDQCRRMRVTATDSALEDAIVTLLGARARDASICPSEVARQVGGESWQSLMEPTRMAARRLVAQGKVQITQGGKVVDPSRAKGPIRIRLARR